MIITKHLEDHCCLHFAGVWMNCMCCLWFFWLGIFTPFFQGHFSWVATTRSLFVSSCIVYDWTCRASRTQTHQSSFMCFSFQKFCCTCSCNPTSDVSTATNGFSGSQAQAIEFWPNHLQVQKEWMPSNVLWLFCGGKRVWRLRMFRLQKWWFPSRWCFCRHQANQSEQPTRIWTKNHTRRTGCCPFQRMQLQEFSLPQALLRMLCCWSSVFFQV